MIRMKYSMLHCYFTNYFQYMLILNFIDYMGANETSIVTRTTPTTAITTTIISELELISSRKKFICDTHENCSSRVLTLDAYCCQSDSYCCNWFEFAIKFSRFNSTLEYKPPTSLTIFTLLIITIAFMFILYCFCVLFCYCFKCGLFRKPKLVIINSMPASNSSDSTSAQIISPKHSSLSSSTSNSSSLSSATSPIANNRTRNQRNRSNSNSRNNYKSSVARVISNQHQNSYNKRSKRTSQSPTARASSNRNSNSQQLYADPQCYVDYDNDTPFLIQSKSSSTRVPSSKQSRSSNPRRSNSSTSASNHNRQSKSYRDNYSSTVQATPLFSSSNSNRSSIQRTTSLSNHPIGTAVALIDDDLLNLNHSNHNQLETIAQSRSNSRSSLSIDLGTSLMEIVESEQINGTNHQQLISINEVASAPYYLDEKPPSYDDIIKNDNLNKTNSS